MQNTNMNIKKAEKSLKLNLKIRIEINGYFFFIKSISYYEKVNFLKLWYLFKIFTILVNTNTCATKNVKAFTFLDNIYIQEIKLVIKQVVLKAIFFDRIHKLALNFSCFKIRFLYYFKHILS